MIEHSIYLNHLIGFSFFLLNRLMKQEMLLVQLVAIYGLFALQCGVDFYC